MQEKELIQKIAQRAELTQEAATRAYRALQAILAEHPTEIPSILLQSASTSPSFHQAA